MRLSAVLAASLALSLIITSCASNQDTARDASRSASPAKASPEPPVARWVIQKAQRFYPDGFPSSSQSYEYDKAGRSLGENEFNSNDVLVIKRKFIYRPDGNIEILTLDPDNTLQAKTIQEFQNGLLTRERVMSAGDEVHFTSDFRYDEHGRKVYWGISGKNALTTVSEYRYQANRLVQITVTGPTKLLLKNYVRLYDSAGQLEREDEFDAQAKLLRQTLYIWEGGLLRREETRSATGVPSSAISYQYDANSHPIKLEIRGQNGELQEIQTQDWIQLQTSRNGK